MASGSAARGELIYGVTTLSAHADTGYHLVAFDSAVPASAPIIGELNAYQYGSYIRAIDFRPSSGELYAVGHNSGNAGRLFRVSLSNASVTPVGSPFAHPYDTLNRATGRMSMSFDPSTDTIRVVTGDRRNLTLHPDTGQVLSIGGNYGFAPGDPNAGTTTEVGDIAYVRDTATAGTATCMAFDHSTNVLGTLGNAGGTPIGAESGLVFSVAGTTLVSVDPAVGFDVSDRTGVAYLSLNQLGTPNSADELYTLDLVTGSTVLLGTSNRNLLDIAVAPVPEPGGAALVALFFPGLRGRRRFAVDRVNGSSSRAA